MITHCYTGDYIEATDDADGRIVDYLIHHTSLLRQMFENRKTLRRDTEEAVAEVQDKLRINVQVLALAETYGFNTLSALAKTRLGRLRSASSFPVDIADIIAEMVDRGVSDTVLGEALAEICLPFHRDLISIGRFREAMQINGLFLLRLTDSDVPRAAAPDAWAGRATIRPVEIPGLSALVHGVGLERTAQYLFEVVDGEATLVMKTREAEGHYLVSGQLVIDLEQSLETNAQRLKADCASRRHLASPKSV